MVAVAAVDLRATLAWRLATVRRLWKEAEEGIILLWTYSSIMVCRKIRPV